jgi:hypothetical protein
MRMRAVDPNQPFPLPVSSACIASRCELSTTITGRYVRTRNAASSLRGRERRLPLLQGALSTRDQASNGHRAIDARASNYLQQ